MTIREIQEAYQGDRVLFTAHARREMMEDEFGQIFEVEVAAAVASGEIIREYPEDRPYPSCLILGRSVSGRPLHLVVALDDSEARSVIVTVYQPDPDRWLDFRTRKPS